MIRNAKVGERVQVINRGSGEPRTGGYTGYHEGDVLHAEFRFSDGNTGTVVEVYNPHGRPWIHVAPDDHCGFGTVVFTASNLRRVIVEDDK